MLDTPNQGVYIVRMERVNFHLTMQQIDRLRKLSEREGLSVAELIRRAVDAYLETRDEKPKVRRGER